MNKYLLEKLDYFSDFHRLETPITYSLWMRVNFSMEVQNEDLLESETEKGKEKDRMKEAKPISMINQHLA